MSPTSVPSPCVGVCALNTASICIGCGRHIDEIAGWSQLAEDAKRTVFATSAKRLAVLRSQTKPAENEG